MESRTEPLVTAITDSRKNQIHNVPATQKADLSGRCNTCRVVRDWQIKQMKCWMRGNSSTTVINNDAN